MDEEYICPDCAAEMDIEDPAEGLEIRCFECRTKFYFVFDANAEEFYLEYT